MKLEHQFEAEIQTFASRVPLTGKPECRVRYHRSGAHTISVCSYPLDGVILQICFSTRQVKGVRNALFSRFLFDGPDSCWNYLIYDLLEEIAPEDFACWQYPGLYSPETLHAAFEALTTRLLELLPGILQLGRDPAGQRRLQERKQAEIARFTRAETYGQLPMASDPALEAENVRIFDTWKETNSFCAPGYQQYLAGNRAGALRRIRALRFSTNYERRLADWLASQPGPLPDPVGPGNVLRQAAAFEKSKRPLLSVLLTWLVLSLPLCGAFLAMYLGAGALLFHGALHVEGFGLPAGMVGAVFAVIAPGGIGAYLLWLRVYGLLFGKRHPQEYAYFQELERGHSRKWAFRLGWVAVCAAILLSLLFAHDGYAFYEDGFSDNTQMLSLSGVWHSYDDIESVWKTRGTVNDFGTWVASPSYAIRMKNGQVFDLYFYTLNEDLETTVAPLWADGYHLILGQAESAETLPK